MSKFLKVVIVLVTLGVGIVCLVESGAGTLYAIGAFFILVAAGFLASHFKIYEV